MAYPESAKQKVFRKIKIASLKKLSALAKFIIESFDFDLDHCYGFYDNIENYSDSVVRYELFVDIGEEKKSETRKGVKNTRIDTVFKKPGDKMLFLFDYGDDWQFVVELKSIEQAERWDLKPILLERVGKSPAQYSNMEE